MADKTFGNEIQPHIPEGECDRCALPRQPATMYVTCAYGCPHHQCARCAAQTQREADEEARYLAGGTDEVPEPDSDPLHAEAEARYGHPLQYALVGARAHYVGNTENMTDIAIMTAAGQLGALTVERYNRCPTCEQWSPCDVRKAEVPPGATIEPWMVRQADTPTP